jgi:hypothetical protein
MKDFLFFNYNWVANSSYIFKSFENCGYSCDFVTENDLMSFEPTNKYRVVVVYLHESWMLPKINFLINNFFADAYVIQHDDTDEEHIQSWLEVAPKLVMQRELTKNSILPEHYRDSVVLPHHFPIQSIYDESLQEKEFDLCFIGTPSNPRRQKFIDKLVELSNTTLSHLRWFIRYGSYKDPQEFRYIVNKTKIGLNFPGNSYDSWRNWEYSSAKVCIIQPKLKVLSVDESHMPFNEYVTINDDLSNLEETILEYLENDKYRIIANDAFNSYNTNHTPEKCFEKYCDIVIKATGLDRLDIIPLSALTFFDDKTKAI